jgi:ParB-like chromosome segregation protein Spo0J
MCVKIIKKKIVDIIPYVNNAKEHPQWQIDQIKSSIQEFGFNDPIAIDEKNVIIEGHGRFMALKQLGFEEVDVIKLDHLSEVQKKQYILAHNKLNMNTEFNEEILELEIEKIKDLDGDLDILGFDEKELKYNCNNDIDFDELEEEIGVDNEKEKATKLCPHCGGEI